MDTRILWLVLIALLGLDIALLARDRQSSKKIEEVVREARIDSLESAYADEEQKLMVGLGKLSGSISFQSAEDPERVEFLLVTSIRDCTNSVQEEITALNEMLATSPSNLAVGARGFYVDVERAELAAHFLENLSPKPEFPFSIHDALKHLPEGASTPLVLAVRSRDGAVLDAYKPIPENIGKREAFYARWRAILGLG